MLQLQLLSRKWLYVASFLLIVCGYANTTLASGFDFPLGKPNAIGYYGVQGLGGLDFLEPYDYGGKCGWTFHPGEDWNADGSGLDFGGDGNDAGDPVYAASDGIIAEVVQPLDQSNWGGVILVQHDGNFNLPEGGQISRVWSQYGHLANISINPRTGAQWKKTDVVSRGFSTGHFCKAF